MKRALCGACLCVMLSVCSDSTPVTGWPFDPIEFFTGHTRGEARLRTIVGSSRRVLVDSVGTPDGHGGLVLVQTIAEQGHPPRVRRWALHPAGKNRWAGALTDAAGAATVTRTSADVTIAY